MSNLPTYQPGERIEICVVTWNMEGRPALAILVVHHGDMNAEVICEWCALDILGLFITNKLHGSVQSNRRQTGSLLRTASFVA